MKRQGEFELITDILKQKKSHFLYLRGRRRVGKSWIMTELENRNKNVFYFMGSKDARNEVNIDLFIEKWELFSGSQNLSVLKKSLLNWNKIFQEITDYLKKHEIILALDEIQWIAKTGSGFCGLLKQYWLQWEKTNRMTVIICGSSNKFFHDESGGEEQLLRGLKTHSDIWVQPFTLPEVYKFKFKTWSKDEVVLLYMLVGGIPYYLQQIDEKKGFIHAINSALFLKSSIFLEEVNEILRIEFNKSSVETVKTILREFGQKGTQQYKIEDKTFLSKSSISETIEKLTDYSIVFSDKPINFKKIKNQAGITYYFKDFFLHTYYQILEPLAEKIKANSSSLVFPVDVLKEKKSLYISDFTGEAFERLLRHCLETESKKYPKLFSRLQLVDNNFQVHTYRSHESEIDILIAHKKDRIIRVVECKWIQKKNIKFKDLCLEVINKKFVLPEGSTRKNYLFLSFKPSAAEQKMAHKMQIVILTINDLF